MENVKQCPHCGGEILQTARKCRHCGKWIEKKCPVCGEWILAEAKKCKHCGSWLNKFTREKYEPQTADAGPSLTREQIQEEIEDADDKGNASCLLHIETGVMAALFWWAYDSVWIMLIAIVVLELLLCIRAIRIIYCLAVSLVWAAIGYEVAGGGGAAILGILSLILHYPAMKSGFN